MTKKRCILRKRSRNLRLEPDAVVVTNCRLGSLGNLTQGLCSGLLYAAADGVLETAPPAKDFLDEVLNQQGFSKATREHDQAAG